MSKHATFLQPWTKKISVHLSIFLSLKNSFFLLLYRRWWKKSRFRNPRLLSIVLKITWSRFAIADCFLDRTLSSFYYYQEIGCPAYSVLISREPYQRPCTLWSTQSILAVNKSAVLFFSCRILLYISRASTLLEVFITLAFFSVDFLGM